MGRGMRAHKKPRKQGGKAMAEQMQKLGAMQEKMNEAQKNIDAMELETSAGGGAVKVKVNGKKEVVSLNIDKDIVDPEDVEMLEDLVIAAVNEGIRQIEEASSKAMEDITSGIEIPGMM